jgi:hypothetical protein
MCMGEEIEGGTPDLTAVTCLNFKFLTSGL